MAAPVEKPARPWPEEATSAAARLARVGGLGGRVAALEAENAALRARVGALEAENAALKADNAALREKLGRPPKTPGNSGQDAGQFRPRRRAIPAKTPGNSGQDAGQFRYPALARAQGE